MAENHDPGSAIGTITHYFGHLSVAAVALEAQLKVGDRIHIRGHTTDLVQQVDSLQIEHAAVQQAGPGDDVALKVNDHVRIGDHVYREE
jgi:translation elongation factor EF-1alpha